MRGCSRGDTGPSGSRHALRQSSNPLAARVEKAVLLLLSLFVVFLFFLVCVCVCVCVCVLLKPPSLVQFPGVQQSAVKQE